MLQLGIAGCMIRAQRFRGFGLDARNSTLCCTSFSGLHISGAVFDLACKTSCARP